MMIDLDYEIALMMNRKRKRKIVQQWISPGNQHDFLTNAAAHVRIRTEIDRLVEGKYLDSAENILAMIDSDSTDMVELGMEIITNLRKKRIEDERKNGV